MVAITGLLDALAILTRIPLFSSSRDLDCPGRWTLAWFPLVGGLFGAIWMIWLQDIPGLSLPLRAIGALSSEIILTGGLHWDGWGDVFDGWAAGAARRDDARKDPRIGTAGVLWIVLAAMAFVALWLQLGRAPQAGVVVFMAPVLARTAIAVGVARGKTSERSQLAKWLQEHVNPLGAMVGAIVTMVMITGFWGWPGILGIVIIAALDYLFIGYWLRFYGGLNGDILGATVIFTELSSLSVGLWLWR